MKPFNLEEALAGKNVVTRDGRKVGKIVHFEKIKELCVVAEVLNVFIYKKYDLIFYYINGSWLKSSESGTDLFMEEIEVTKYVIIHYNESGYKTVCGTLFDSFVEAKKHVDSLIKLFGKYPNQIIPIKVKE